MDDFNEFLQHYLQHLDWLQISHPPLPTLKLIHDLFLFVSNNGGWARQIGLNSWSGYSHHPDARQFFESNFLVSFERSLNHHWPYSAEVTKSIDYSLLNPIPIYTQLKKGELDELLLEDLAIYRNVYELGIEKSLMSLESIKRKYGNMQIRVISQESDPAGFSIKKPCKEKMTLGEYIELMNNTKPSKGLIKFAVNIDFGQWKEEIDELRKKLPSKVLWGSKDDPLRYSRQHILGMTLPQLYLKINGCWTGGHEENLRFMSANINHGPSPCEWWGLDPMQSESFRECVKAEKKFDIYNSETLWWPDEIFCLIKGFKLYHSVQQPGDFVIVGPGTIHWVKSCGLTVNSAWNFGRKKLLNFKKSYERENINKSIKYRSLVPMNLLALDLLNYELKDLEIGLVNFLKTNIMVKGTEEKTILGLAKMKKIELNNTDNVIHCEYCYLELFRVYYKCAKCEKNRFAGGNKICFFCFECMKDTHKKGCKGHITAVERFKEADFEKLVKLVERRVGGEVVEGNVFELMYNFDKNIEENVYVSNFNGVQLEKPEENDDKIEKNEVHKVEFNIKIEENEEKEEKIEENKVDINEKVKFSEDIKKCEEKIEKSDIKILNPEVKTMRKNIFKITNSNQTVIQILKIKKTNPKLIPEVKKEPSQISIPKSKNPECKTLKSFQNYVKNLHKPEVTVKKEPSSPETSKNPIFQNVIFTNHPYIKVQFESAILPAQNIKASPSNESISLAPFLPLKRTRNSDLYKPVLEIIPKKS